MPATDYDPLKFHDGMVKAGDKIKVYVAPNRDGSDGGYLVAFETAAGEKIGLDASQRENVVLGEGVVAVVIRCSFYWENMDTVASRKSFVRAVAQSRPPLPRIHCSWLLSSARVLTDGVL